MTSPMHQLDPKRYIGGVVLLFFDRNKNSGRKVVHGRQKKHT